MIRDFIYLNAPMLYSIYSQVFEGITEKLTEETIFQIITGNTENAFFAGKAEKQTHNTEISSESRVLHDYMYTKLEKKLMASIKNVSNLSKDDALSQLKSHFLVEITGRAEIEDYEKLMKYLQSYNDLIKVIAYAAMSSEPQFKTTILSIIEELSLTDKKDIQKKLNDKLKKLTNYIPKAKELNLLQDEDLLKNLALMLNFINPTGFEVLIHSQTTELFYRGIIDRNWLRIPPQTISSLYGGQSEIPWTMVGLVSNIQGTYQKQQSKPAKNTSTESPMMLDAYRNLFRSSRFYERTLLESDTNTEIIISPIAIYRNLFEVKDNEAG